MRGFSRSQSQLCGNAIGFRYVFWRVDVKERIESGARPGGCRDAVLRRPRPDFSHTVAEQGVTQIFAQSDRPQRDDRMLFPVRTRARDRCAGVDASSMQARHQVLRQKWAVARGAHHPFEIGRVCRGPIETRQNTGKRAWIVGDTVSNDLELGIGEARGTPVGVKEQLVTLRAEATDQAVENGHIADTNAEFVVAAEASRQTAGEDQSESGGNGHACFA